MYSLENVSATICLLVTFSSVKIPLRIDLLAFLGLTQKCGQISQAPKA
jgi:hypothetical protein